MSAAGTPSTDPWVIVSRERVRYEEQFRSLKPINGVVTGDQAKGFLLQSQLPPLVLGQIWSLADTDADGKMDINEFSIACKLINLKLRGFDIPPMLPPTLIASLKMHGPPAIPPLPAVIPNVTQPPKIPPLASQPPIIPPPPLVSQTQPLISNMGGGLLSQAPLHTSGIPTGIVPPMQSGLPAVQPMSGVIPPQNVVAPMGQGFGGVQPLAGTMQSGFGTGAPLISGLGGSMVSSAPVGVSMVTAAPTSVGPMVSGMPMGPGAPGVPIGIGAPLTSAVPGMPTVPVASTVLNAIVTPPGHMSPVTGVPVLLPSATSTPRASLSSMDRAPSLESPLVEWAVPHQTKLKYTQIFNTTDRTRSGFLSGPQARNVMVQTKLPQNLLAQIWALSDMDLDGRLGCEEFVLAMHLCEQAALGSLPPAVLPPDMIPPSFRRAPRTNSVSSQGSAPLDQDAASLLLASSFEDKRKENFDKGQAELDRRRKTLLEQQRKEAEERERKEREEIDRREKARQEAERRRMDELEKQMREQQEQERLKEEDRKRQADQREAARREMERQRQLEWEKQRSQDLQQQRQREQETVLKLKAKNQSLTIELSSFNEQVKELSQKICDTRVGVSNVKSTIDGMRSTRDTQMQEMSQLKNRLKEQNAKLLALSQEKAKLDAKNKLNMQLNDQQSEQVKQAYENRDITIKNLREKLEDMQKQIDGKMADIENNNSQLGDLRGQLTSLVSECESLYTVYEEKRNKVMEMKNVNRSVDYGSAWKDTGSWGNSGTGDAGGEWPVDNWATSSVTPAAKAATEPPPTITAAVVRYKALYEFVARNNDEVSFQPGDIIHVPLEQTGEPGWLAGEIRGHTGWFPESYVEPVDGVGIQGRTTAETIESVQDEEAEEIESKRLEGIAEVPETIPEPVEVSKVTAEPPPTAKPELNAEPLEICVACYPYQSVEQGDLSFNAGDIIAVMKKDGDWWTGKVGESVGLFPSNYVQKYDPNSSTNPVASNNATPPATAVPPAISSIPQQDFSSTQMDNEVSQLTDNKILDRPPPPDFANVQILKGSKKPEIASVIAPYQATSPEQLSLARGQLIMIRKRTDSGWWEGELQAKGKKRQVGWFPASYVKILNSSGRASGRTTPVSSTRMQQEVVIDKVIALYPYIAANPDELTFTKDDIISVTAREEPSWWRGELNGVSGLFPSNYVTPLQQSVAEPVDKTRQDAVNELIQTEKAYIDDMTVVHEVFEIPLRQSGIISSEEIDGIFVNWQDILQCNRNFLVDLMSRRNSGNDNIGDIVCSHLPLMTAYIMFCSRQLESAALLQRLTESSTAFREIVKRCQSNRLTKGMPLSSFLIKPMQRITRYPLLISKIIENTPQTHSDYPFLTEALQLADKFLKTLNENVRFKENEERLEWLQKNVQLNEYNITFNAATNKVGRRKVQHYGMLSKVKSGKELIGFLFNDFFLLVQLSKSLGSMQFNFQRNTNIIYKIYRQPILIQDLKAVKGNTDNVENGTDANRVLKIQDKKQVISLLTPTLNECNLWLKRIESAKEMYTKIISLSKARPKSIHSFARAWLKLTIVEAHEVRRKRSTKSLKRTGKPHSDNIYCKVYLGDQEQQTDIATDNILNGNVPQNGVPQVPTLIWNYSMQFHIRNVNEETLSIVVYELCPFQPDEFLGRAEVKIADIYRETQSTNGPITKKLILHQVESGEVIIKVDMQMFNSNY